MPLEEMEMEKQFEVGAKVSFVHEGAGFRIFGIVTAIDGDSVTIDVDGRQYEASLELDSIEVAA